ncbi:MAG: hypothetical protein PIR02_15965 [Microbacterium enclense]
MSAGIDTSEFTDDEDLGLVLLLRACEVAPQLRTVVENSREKRTAIAILRRVASRVAEAGTGAVESMGRNGTNIKLRDIGDAFQGPDLADLRRLFGIAEPEYPGARGSFPTERPLSKLWRETYE